MNQYVITYDFTANDGKTRVKGRIDYELASSPKEAEEKMRDYLKYWKYTDITVTDCHEENWEEKYGKLPKLEEPVQETPKPPPPTPVQCDDDGELF